MHRTSVRIACLVVCLAATGALSYRAFVAEAALTKQQNDAMELDRTVGRTAGLILDLRASLHAYVAPRQGLPFWGKRAQEGIQTLRQQLASLDDRIAPSGRSLKQSLDGVAQLEAAERRARTYASRDEMQLAGDVVFTEVRDVLDAMTREVESIASVPGLDHRAAAIRRQQLQLAGAALALWIVLAVLLVPMRSRSADPAAWRNELKATLSRPIHTAESGPASASAREGSGELRHDPVEAQSSRESGSAELVPVRRVRVMAEICADLAALTDTQGLQGALQRVADVLDATRLIVWAASEDGGSLAPLAAHGFDPRLLAKIGTVARDSANLTAAAFRDGATRTSAPAAVAPGAVAVPMFSPTGPIGVLSLELKPGQPIDESQVALAAIAAAQLATLTVPVPGAAATEPLEAPQAKAQSA